MSLKQIPISITEHPYGRLADGRTAKQHTLRNSQGLTAKLTNYGGIITELHVPDYTGNFDDIVLGCNNLETYTTEHPYFGAIIGRVAGRISQAQFEPDQKIYRLAANQGSNCLLGGVHGFDSQLWDAHCSEIQEQAFIEFSLTDPDGNDGFPGKLQYKVRYSLSDANDLRIEYRTCAADDGTLTRKIVPVKVGLNDFRDGIELGSLSTLDKRNADTHYFMPAGRTAEPEAAAKIVAPTSGRVMEVSTTEPGLQFHAVLHVDATVRNQNEHQAIYLELSGFCIETQNYPDAVNWPDMGGALLRPGQIFESTTCFRFSTIEAMDARH